MTDAVLILLKNAIGHFISEVDGLFFIPRGTSNYSMDSLVQLRIRLGVHSFRLFCDPNGESLVVDQGDLCEGDLGAYGELRRLDLANDTQLSKVINSPLLEISQVTSHAGAYVIGVLLRFSVASLVICNWGDKLTLWNEVPVLLFAEEGIKIA